MTLDHATLRRLSGLADPLGVLSLYVTIDPTQEASDRPVWKVRMENSLAQLRERFAGEKSREHREALENRLDALAPQLQWLVDPRQPGRGHALFAPLSNDDFHQVTVQLEVGDEVACDTVSHVRPLLSVWERGAPAGIAAVSADGLRLIDFRFGLATDVGGVEFNPNTQQWRERTAPPGSAPAGQRTVSLTDMFEARMSEHLRRFLVATSGTIHRHIREHDWEYLVVSGDPRLRDAVLADIGHEPGARLVESPQVVGSATPARAAELVAAELDEARQAHERDLLDRARESKRVAWGLSETLAALDQGQVETILMREDGRWPGRATESGRLSPPGVVPPGVSEAELRDLPDLSEWIISRAHRDAAAVELLQNGSRDGLDAADGLAALLRW